MVKKKAKTKLDPRLRKLRDAYMFHRRKQNEQHNLAIKAGQAFASLSAALAGIKVGDFIAVSSFGREIPAVVESIYASSNDWQDDALLNWKIRYRQVKRDGLPHGGYGPRNVYGSNGDSCESKWRKISKDAVASLLSQ